MSRLTDIELQVLRGLAEGRQSKEIASLINRSKASVDVVIRILFAKFDARSRSQLMVNVLTQGVLPIEELAGGDGATDERSLIG
jgi:DNA-binding NarL/FixJ family response regulator